MIPEWVAALPDWLVFGAVLGVAASAGVAGLFVLADRYFPSTTEPGRRDDTENRRRVEIREYLDAIGEQYAEGHPVAGQHVDFYLPKRDVAITFDARAYYRIDRTPTHPVLVEHELPGVALGARLPFETPDVRVEEPDDEPEQQSRGIDPTVAAYAELGLPAGAGLDEVQAAYRERVKEVHPDQGGDEDEFKRVREAYTTAKQHAS